MSTPGRELGGRGVLAESGSAGRDRTGAFVDTGVAFPPFSGDVIVGEEVRVKPPATNDEHRLGIIEAYLLRISCLRVMLGSSGTLGQPFGLVSSC